MTTLGEVAKDVKTLLVKQEKRDLMFFGEDGRGGFVKDMHDLVAFKERMETEILERQNHQRAIIYYLVFPVIVGLVLAVSALAITA